jgi:hypothetical protein
MAQKTLRDVLASTASRPKSDTLRVVDEAAREAIARESSARYRRLVAELNRSRDTDIDRALRRT